MAFLASIYQAPDFLESEFLDHLLKLIASIRTNHQCNLIDEIALFKTLNGMDHDRLPAKRCSQLVKAHSLAAASGYNNSGDHWSVGVSVFGGALLATPGPIFLGHCKQCPSNFIRAPFG